MIHGLTGSVYRNTVSPLIPELTLLCRDNVIMSMCVSTPVGTSAILH